MSIPIEESWRSIEAWLEANAPLLRANLNPGASESALREAETSLGIEMPADWRALYGMHDGMNDAGNFGSLFYGMQFMPLKRVLEERSSDSAGATAKVPIKSADPGINKEDLHNPKWVSLTHDFGDTQLRIDMDAMDAGSPEGRSGQVIFTDQSYRVAILVAPSIADLLASFAEDLQKGLYTLNKEALADGNQFLDCAKEIDIVNWYSSPRWKHLSS